MLAKSAVAPWICVLLILSIFLPEARSGGGNPIDPVWRDKARNEIKAILDRYEPLSKRIEEESEIRYDKLAGSVGDGFIPHTRIDRIIRLGDNMILDQTRIYDDEKGKPQTTIQCDNGDYHFDVTKNNDKSAYVLLGHGLQMRKYPLINQGGFGLHGHVFGYLKEVMKVVGEDPKYVLRKLQHDGKTGFVRIEYTVNNVMREIRLDPQNQWQIREERTETPSLKVVTLVTYGKEQFDGLQFPNWYKNVTKYTVEKAPPDMEIIGKLISIKLTRKTESDFRMTAFGLLEPMGAPPLPNSTRWYIWLPLAAAGALVLSFVFFKLRGRFLRTEMAKP